MRLLKVVYLYEYALVSYQLLLLDLILLINDDDKDLFNNYFKKMIHKLDADEYYNNPYYKNIKIPTIKIGNSELKYEKYKPFEGFVCNDIIQTKEGRQIPQIGFFDNRIQVSSCFRK